MAPTSFSPMLPTGKTADYINNQLTPNQGLSSHSYHQMGNSITSKENSLANRVTNLHLQDTGQILSYLYWFFHLKSSLVSLLEGLPAAYL